MPCLACNDDRWAFLHKGGLYNTPMSAAFIGLSTEKFPNDSCSCFYILHITREGKNNTGEKKSSHPSSWDNQFRNKSVKLHKHLYLISTSKVRQYKHFLERKQTKKYSQDLFLFWTLKECLEWFVSVCNCNRRSMRLKTHTKMQFYGNDWHWSVIF